MSYLQKTLTLQDWFAKVYQKSKSESSVKVAKSAINAFNSFCKHKYNKPIEEVIEELKIADDNARCIALNYFLSFLNSDHAELNQKKRDPSSILAYFSFLKSFLWSQGIKLNPDDVKHLIQFPTKNKISRKAIDRQTIKLILDNSSSRRKALYLSLTSSGMRDGEALSLRKRDFDFSQDPVLIKIPAKYTKTREARETYISNEAKKYVERLVKRKKDDDLVFTNTENRREAVDNEGEVFGYLRKKLGLTERYEGSSRHVITLHVLRSYFYSIASDKHGADYAHAMIGHSPYMATYYRKTPEDRARMYKELEPLLTIDDSERLIVRTKELEKEKSVLKQKVDRIDDLERRLRRMEKTKDL